MSERALLLHVCCGPCATAVIERLAPAYDLTLLWYNPNIHPTEECIRRLQAARDLADRLGLTLHVHEGGEAEFAAVAQGLEYEPEGGERCRRCYALRLRHALETARTLGLPTVATTLSISPHKPAAAINEVGRRLADELGLTFLEADFKQQAGFQRSVELSKQYGLYRQNYCGCEFSRRR